MIRAFAGSWLAAAALLGASDGPPIDRERLIAERDDPRAHATAPPTGLRTRQFSSFDRKAARADKNWFAENDQGHFLRSELHGERREWVLADAQGPGAITRIWIAPPRGTLRVYLDDAEGGAELQLAGTELPLASAFVSRDPWTFARRCVVTIDQPNDLEYHVEAREYASATAVTTSAATAWAREPAQAAPTATQAAEGRITRAFDGLLSPANAGAPLSEVALDLAMDAAGSPGAIEELEIALEALDPAPGALTDVLRRTILAIEFDGERTVDVPVGDFFATPIGLAPHESRLRLVRADGAMIARHWMPFRERARLSLRQSGSERVMVRARVVLGPLSPDVATAGSSLRFHALWNAASGVIADPPRAFEQVSIEGRGWLIGDVLVCGDRSTAAQLARGDEKLYVDGESFPSYFGTSIDGYYDRAGGDRRIASGPWSGSLHPDGAGWSAFYRWRGIDAIPFHSGLRFERELVPHSSAALEIASTVFFYAAPGARVKTTAPDELACVGVVELGASDASDAPTDGDASR